MKFTRLRLSGFKSFVEPTELFIEPGLTAVVGPNGCGKSNLFDAMRWVMGETRPTSVRGAEMDDVIFSGSAGRPARNVAEVTLFIDNSDRQVSGSYGEYDTIEISRRIEREAGSVYRINGRDVRQRDVQIFFADASSGAGSTAFVRQGQIGLLISQKPLARRAILEEAAGIGGLHQRRHEAELRLRAAETNLSRLQDVIGEVETQLQNLKRQARQASRYRNLSGHIRKAEALAHYLRWTAAELRAAAVAEELAAAAALVAATTDDAARASTAQAEIAAGLPPMRQGEAEKSAALQRLIVERGALDAEETRARESAQRIRQLIAQGAQDIERERALAGDAEAALLRLEKEKNQIDASAATAGEETAKAGARATELGAALADAECLLEKLNAELAEFHARKASFERGRQVAAALVDTSSAQLKTVQERMRGGIPVSQRIAGDAEKLRRDADVARAWLAQAETAEIAARGPLETAEHEVQRLSGEAKALGDFLHPEGEGLFPPLIDAVTVQNGYEAALAACLGDDLQAPLDEAAPHHWRELTATDSLPPLPAGTRSLDHFVKAPRALARRLAMTGVVFPDQGAALQKQLKPGQRLVSARGDLWRWDGYAASAEAPSRAAVRLSQRGRLAALEGEIAAAKEARAAAFAQYGAAKDAAGEAREAMRTAEQTMMTAAMQTAELASLEAEIRRLSDTRNTALESEQQAIHGLAQLGDGAALMQRVADTRALTADARATSSEARAVFDGRRREGENRAGRLKEVADDAARWQTRHAATAQHIGELERRRGELEGELAAAEKLPGTLSDKRNALLGAVANAEAARNQASDARVAAENRLAEADRHSKAADAVLSAAREDRVRAQALCEAANARIEELRTRIRDELDAAPEELAARAEIENGQELPPLDQAEKRAERLKQEREQLGGVNLRAEEEAAEQEQRLQTLTGDRDDLQGAIDRLRRGIQSLNREGRERLVESFEKVNRNFSTLFAKLFEGGEAKLTFTESEDPLEAGLEIFARPPGKRLQSLALLSGGEQALTALALIFAVFLVNPAPVCVLDEVDAPLDDANVERFCNLLDEMTRLAGTRFLVITHHALTMSRMHRLFGVTMAERGISQLVSVNLAEAEKAAAE